MTFHHAILGGVLFGVGLLVGAAPTDREDAARAGDSLMQVSEDMSREMARVRMVGDPDVDFANMMVVHHLGAIGMAKVVLEQGTDPQIRAMAQKVIDDQTREIEDLQRWLLDRRGTK